MKTLFLLALVVAPIARGAPACPSAWETQRLGRAEISVEYFRNELDRLKDRVRQLEEVDGLRSSTVLESASFREHVERLIEDKNPNLDLYPRLKTWLNHDDLVAAYARGLKRAGDAEETSPTPRTRIEGALTRRLAAEAGLELAQAQLKQTQRACHEPKP